MRILLKVVITLGLGLLLLVGYCTYSEILSTYKFGIIKNDYPQYFTKENNELNPEYYEIISSINDYSPLTKIRSKFNDTNQIISIEHLVRVSNYDIELIPEIKNNNHLFFAIEFEKGKVNNINVVHKYDGKELEAVGTYIYHYPIKPNGEIDNDKKFIVRKINSDLINERDRFVYVKIYKMPQLQSGWLYQHLVRQKYWFTKPIKETITVKYAEKDRSNKVTYEFDILWKIRSSFWSNLLTIT